MSEEFEFFGGEVYLLAVDADGVSGEIYFYPADRYLIPCRYGSIVFTVKAAASQVCFYPCDEFCGAERFGDVVITADGKSEDFVHILVLAADEEDRYIALFPYLAAEFHA